MAPKRNRWSSPSTPETVSSGMSGVELKDADDDPAAAVAAADETLARLRELEQEKEWHRQKAREKAQRRRLNREWWDGKGKGRDKGKGKGFAVRKRPCEDAGEDAPAKRRRDDVLEDAPVRRPRDERMPRWHQWEDRNERPSRQSARHREDSDYPAAPAAPVRRRDVSHAQSTAGMRSPTVLPPEDGKMMTITPVAGSRLTVWRQEDGRMRWIWPQPLQSAGRVPTWL